MTKANSQTKTVRVQDAEGLERARRNLQATMPDAKLSDTVIVTAGLGALNEKLENKMLPASEVSRVAAILANDVASKAIVTIIKSFYEDKNPDADNILVEYQPVSGWLRVTVDDGEPLIFCPDDQEQPATKGVDATKH